MRVDHVCVVGSRLCRRFPLLHPRGIPRIVAQTKHCPGGPARGRFYPPLVWALDVFTRWPMMFRRQRPESADFARSSPEKMGRSRRRCDDRGRTRRRSRCRTSCTARGGRLATDPARVRALEDLLPHCLGTTCEHDVQPLRPRGVWRDAHHELVVAGAPAVGRDARRTTRLDAVEKRELPLLCAPNAVSIETSPGPHRLRAPRSRTRSPRRLRPPRFSARIHGMSLANRRGGTQPGLKPYW